MKVVELLEHSLQSAVTRIKKLESLPAGEDFIRSRDVGLVVATKPVRIPNVTKKLLKEHPPEDVLLDEIQTCQGYILRSKLIKLLEEGAEVRDPLVCVAQHEKLFLVDGNHRLAALKIAGKKIFKAHVLPGKT